jgi:hypothetical protein
MFQQCTHILASGQRCQAPARTGTGLCRHHHPHKPQREDRRFVLPPLSEPSSVLYAVTEVVQAMAERRIKRSEAATLLFGLRLTANLMNDIDRAARQAAIAGIEPEYNAPEGFEERNMEEAKTMLSALQTSSVEKVLDQWHSKRPQRPVQMF